ncbi:uncharacterized protein V6R79_004216 [Siganus canaliculatus]
MAVALAFLLIGCLLQGSMSREFKATIPETMSVLSGSCVTIPCGFDIKSEYDRDLDGTCRAKWIVLENTVVFDSSDPQQSEIKGTFQGNLQRKNCTTTLNSMQPQHGNDYVFRLECNNRLKWIYKEQILKISVKDELPSLTLSPTTLEVTEGTTVRLTCSAPAPCRSHPPALSWSPRVGEAQETLQVNPDKTEFKMSVMNFKASFLDHGQNISCTAVYPKEDGSEVSVHAALTANVSYSPKNTTASISSTGPVPEDSIICLRCRASANPEVSTFTWLRADGDQETEIGSGSVLNILASKIRSPVFCKAQNRVGTGRSDPVHADVQLNVMHLALKVVVSLLYQHFPCFFSASILDASQILASSDCTRSAQQLNCSCETVGNPAPTLQWLLNGASVNQSDGFSISTERLNATNLRSIITVSQPQQTDLSTLLCHSFNSQGSATQRFYIYSMEPQASAVVAGLVTLPVFIAVVGVLLLIVCVLLFIIWVLKTQHSRLKSALTLSQPVINNERPSARDDSIYANISVPPQAYATHPAAAHEAANSFNSDRTKSEGDGDVTYSVVKRKSTWSKGDDAAGVNEHGVSYLEEERSTKRSMSKNVMSNVLDMGSLYDDVGVRNVTKQVECEYAQLHCFKWNQQVSCVRLSKAVRVQRGFNSGKAVDLSTVTHRWAVTHTFRQKPFSRVLQQYRSWTITVPRTVTAVEGSCVVVPCHTQNHSRVIWYQYHSVRYPVVYDGLDPRAVESKFRGRTSAPGEAKEGNCTLMIDNMRREDNKLQVYVWINPGTKANMKFHQQLVTINVERKKPIIHVQRQLIVGEIFETNCSISYSCPVSHPALSWKMSPYLENTTFMSFIRKVQGLWQYTETLHGRVTHYLHGSILQCSAQFTSLRTESRQIILRVLYKPVNVTLIRGKKEVTEGGDIMMECVASCNPQPHTYTWLKRQMGQDAKITSSDQRITLSNVTRHTSVACFAQNDIGASLSAWVDLNVQYAPVILPESFCNVTGVFLDCICRAESTPTASINWIIDGNAILSPAFSFFSRNDRKTVSGIMRGPAQNQSTIACTATNFVGRTTVQLPQIQTEDTLQETSKAYIKHI